MCHPRARRLHPSTTQGPPTAGSGPCARTSTIRHPIPSTNHRQTPSDDGDLWSLHYHDRVNMPPPCSAPVPVRSSRGGRQLWTTSHDCAIVVIPQRARVPSGCGKARAGHGVSGQGGREPEALFHREALPQGLLGRCKGTADYTGGRSSQSTQGRPAQPRRAILPLGAGRLRARGARRLRLYHVEQEPADHRHHAGQATARMTSGIRWVILTAASTLVND